MSTKNKCPAKNDVQPEISISLARSEIPTECPNSDCMSYSDIFGDHLFFQKLSGNILETPRNKKELRQIALE